MKKQKLKNYLKFGILLFGISSLITSCEKDFENNSFNTIEQSKFKSRCTFATSDFPTENPRTQKRNSFYTRPLPLITHSLKSKKI